ncbi:MAG TPA: tetratricopeptide repeat protein [Candidatus Angelobacter sp.]|nr:tetratricopeptide repeat protein [Candidatus Angelobacter sp.]
MQPETLQSAVLPVPEKRHTTTLCGLLILLTVVFYSPVRHNSFLFFDDNTYVFENPVVQAGLTWKTVKWAFISHNGNWHPVTWLSHALDCQLFHLNPAGHHLMNVLLHAGCAVILFLLLLSVTGRRWPAFLVAGLFALHPINVESVAWAAERKNVLSMLFGLLTLWAYGWYARKGGARRYAVMMLSFALGLMAKSQIIMLPFVLLLWDYWPLRRMHIPFSKQGSGPPDGNSFFRLLLEKAPMFLLSLGCAVMTVWSQHAGNAVRSLNEFSLHLRMENALVAYVRYLGKAFWPWHLAPMYPLPAGNSSLLWQAVACAVLLIVVSILVWRRREHRYPVVGWLWFLVTLAPMIGIIQVGEQAMADRFAHLPFIGLFVMVVWGVADAVARWKVSPARVAALSATVLFTLGALSYRQIGYWRDGVTLWEYTLGVTKNNYMAQGHLAIALSKEGRAEEAMPHFLAALALHEYPAADLFQLAVWEQGHGFLRIAAAHYARVVRGSSDPALTQTALASLASLYLETGNYAQAQEAFEGVLRINPNHADALIGSGLVAQRSGNLDLAMRRFSQAVSVQPRDIGFLLLAGTLRQAGRITEAQRAEEQARMISPNFPRAEQAANRLLVH